MQVAVGESEALAELFAADCRRTVAHSGGHHVPATRAHVARYRDFLSAFLQYILVGRWGNGLSEHEVPHWRIA